MNYFDIKYYEIGDGPNGGENSVKAQVESFEDDVEAHWES